MSEPFRLRIADHIDVPDKKRRLNEEMFGVIAPKYDFITRGLSFGRDRAWKRWLMTCLPALDAPLCVDLACGTGDLSRLLAERYLKGRVTGIDITEPMLRIARKKHQLQNVTFRAGDMCSIDLPASSVDVVTGGYALRNAPDLECALREVVRVLKPGGVAVFLDFSKPASRMGQELSCGLLKVWGSLWGLALHGNAEVYAYIAESLKRFPDRTRLGEVFAECGLQVVRRRTFFLGVIEVLQAERM